MKPSNICTFFISLLVLSAPKYSFSQSSDFIPWCEEAALSEYQAAQQYETNTVASGLTLNTEISVPICIIYVNEDDGTPPQNVYSISSIIDNANTAFDGFLNFYICRYQHVNSTSLTTMSPTEKTALFNLFHTDDAVNVYIVKNLQDAQGQTIGGSAVYPWTSGGGSNMIVLDKGQGSGNTLAHELGHFFGLFHTHGASGYFKSTNNCFLYDPATDFDMVGDTPADPGPVAGACVQACPKATSACTLTCNAQTPSVTYTYVNYLTNNMMSYHSCPSMVFTPGQFDRMEFYLETARSFLLTTSPVCNNTIAEKGLVQSYCSYASPQPSIVPLGNIQVNYTNSVTNWSNKFSTNASGAYSFFPGDFSNQVSVTVAPRKSHPTSKVYYPLYGVSTLDMVLTNRHILGIEFLQPPYSYIAADVNNSRSITVFDLVLIRKLILGIETVFPAGTWRFVPEYYFQNQSFATAFESSPFGAYFNGAGYLSYMDAVTLNMDDDAVSNPNSWAFRAVKVGDVNCDNGVFGFDDQPGTSSELVTIDQSELNCAESGDVISLSLDASANQPVSAYQLGFKYNTNYLQFLGASSGEITDFSNDNFYAQDNFIKSVWHKTNGQSESLSVPKELFQLQFKVLEDFCDITEYLQLDNEILSNIFYTDSGESEAVNLNLHYQEEASQGEIISIYPNPFSSSMTFNFEIEQSSFVEIRLSDYTGNQLTYSNQYLTGLHSYTFENVSSLSIGIVNYVVKIGNVTYSGVLLKS